METVENKLPSNLNVRNYTLCTDGLTGVCKVASICLLEWWKM